MYRRIAQSSLSIPLQYINTYLHLKVNNLIESFIVKLEQFFVFGANGQLLDLFKSNYIYLYKNLGALPTKASEFF